MQILKTIITGIIGAITLSIIIYLYNDLKSDFNKTYLKVESIKKVMQGYSDNYQNHIYLLRQKRLITEKDYNELLKDHNTFIKSSYKILKQE